MYFLLFQSRQQTAVHLVASRQTGTATAILRALLAAAGKDIRLKPDGVSTLFYTVSSNNYQRLLAFNMLFEINQLLVDKIRQKTVSHYLNKPLICSLNNVSYEHQGFFCFEYTAKDYVHVFI